jgi:hypothetical protein
MRRTSISFRFLFPFGVDANAMELARADGISPVLKRETREADMGRYLLLWLLGIPLPILLLIWVFGGLH